MSDDAPTLSEIERLHNQQVADAVSRGYRQCEECNGKGYNAVPNTYEMRTLGSLYVTTVTRGMRVFSCTGCHGSGVETPRSWMGYDLY